MVMALVRTFSTILFGQLDAAAFDLINRADVHAVSADDFHMFFNVHFAFSVRTGNAPGVQ